MIVSQLYRLSEYLPDHDYTLVVKFVNEVDLSHPEVGQWFMLDADRLKVILLDKSNFKDGIFEAHRKYQDIHITLKGKDLMHYADHKHCTVSAPYVEADDYELQTGPFSAVTVLHPGAFAILEPGELHANKIEDAGTLKVVVKRKLK
jgi:biofilm protein TabA